MIACVRCSLPISGSSCEPCKALEEHLQNYVRTRSGREVLRRALRPYAPHESATCSVVDIVVKLVSEELQVQGADVRLSRDRTLGHARAVVALVLRRHDPHRWSYPALVREFSEVWTDHTTPMGQIKRLLARLPVDAELRARVERIEAALAGKRAA